MNGQGAQGSLRESLASASWFSALLSLHLPKHPDQHRPKHPILLAVDQQLGEGAGLGVRPVRADSVGAVEVSEPEGAEQLRTLGAWDCIQALPEHARTDRVAHRSLVRAADATEPLPAPLRLYSCMFVVTTAIVSFNSAVGLNSTISVSGKISGVWPGPT